MTTESPGTDSSETETVEETPESSPEPTAGANAPESDSDGAIVEIVDDAPCVKRMKVEIPAETVTTEVDSNYRQLMTTIQLPGFRKGRVPRSVLERRYSEQIEGEVKEELLHSTFSDEVDERDLKIIGAPRFDNVEFNVGDPLRFEVVFEIPPQFELGEYKGLGIEARAVEIPESEVERELESLREQYSSWEDLSLGSLEEGDVVVADVRLGQGEESIDREDVYLKLGTDRVDNIQVEGLSGRLASANESDQLEFQVLVPEDFPREDLRGETTDLRVTVKTARRRNLPEVDAEFVKNFGVETPDELRDSMRKNLETRRRVQEEHRQEEELLEMVSASVEMDLPPTLLDRRKADLSLGMSYRLMREGKNQEEIEEVLAKDTSALDDARKELTQAFILDRIADNENILITEDEVEQRIKAIALAYDRDPQEVLEDYVERGEMEELRSGLLREKVRRELRKHAKVTGAPGVESTEGEHRRDDEEQNAE